MTEVAQPRATRPSVPPLGLRSLVDPRALSRATKRGLLAPFLFTLTLRLALLVAMPIQPAWDGAIYARIADDLAEGEGYTHASIEPSQSRYRTAFFPVGFPAAIAPLRGLGAGRALDPIAQCLLGAMIVPIAGLLGRRTAGARGGRAAAWLAALWPGGVLLSLSWMSEPLFTLLTSAAVLVVAMARRSKRDRAIVLAALLLALAAYVRPTAGFVAVTLVVAVAWARPGARRARAKVAARHLAIVGVVFAVVLAPWALRNLDALGSPALVSTNGGTNMLLGTIGEGRYGSIPPELDCPARTEIERDRCRAARAWERIAESPGDALARALLKLSHTFGHESGPAELWARSLQVDETARASARYWALGISRVAWLLILIGTVAGAALLSVARRRALLATLLAPAIALAVLHSLTIGGDRYHAPAVPAAIALVAVAWVAYRRARSRSRSV